MKVSKRQLKRIIKEATAEEMERWESDYRDEDRYKEFGNFDRYSGQKATSGGGALLDAESELSAVIKNLQDFATGSGDVEAAEFIESQLPLLQDVQERIRSAHSKS